MKPTLNYLPQWHAEADQEVYRKLTSILDQVVKRVEFDISGLRNKYLDYSSLNRDLTQLVIREMGYDYITDVLELDDEQLHIILGYLGVIHAFKGTKPGLELCLRLIGASSETIEWWEANPTKTPDTFSLLINLNLSTMKLTTMRKLRGFIRQYVYPILDVIEYTLDATLSDLGMGIVGILSRTVQGKIRLFPGIPLFIRTRGAVSHTIRGEIRLIKT